MRLHVKAGASVRKSARCELTPAAEHNLQCATRVPNTHTRANDHVTEDGELCHGRRCDGTVPWLTVRHRARLNMWKVEGC